MAGGQKSFNENEGSNALLSAMINEAQNEGRANFPLLLGR